MNEEKKREFENKASKIREDIIQACYKNSGHLSSNLGTVELTLSLLDNFSYKDDDILFDVGHQSYTYKILTGRKLDNLREYNGIAPFSSRKESIYDRYDNGHSGDSISTAIGMHLAKKLNNDDSYTIVIIGDSSLNNGLAMEGLNVLSEREDFSKFLLIVNSNSMAIKENNDKRSLYVSNIISSFVSLKENNHEFDEKEIASFIKKYSEDEMIKNKFAPYNMTYYGPVFGNDFSFLDYAFKNVKKLLDTQSVILEVFTKKGYGYKQAMDDKFGFYHGVNNNPSLNKTSFSYYKSIQLDKIFSQDDKAFLISPAMETSSSLIPLFKKYQDRTIDVGIAEEDAITLSSGLALKGYHPYVDIYSTFLQRGIDEVIENVTRSSLNITFLLERASLVEDGESHHGIYDVSLLKGMTNRSVFMPFDITSLNYLLNLKVKGAKFIRLSKDYNIKESKVKINIPITFITKSKTNKTLLLAVGKMGYDLINQISFKGMDLALLLDLLSEKLDELLEYDRIIFYDPYSTSSSTSLNIKEFLFNNKYKGEYIPFTLKDEFITFGSVNDLYKSLNLDIDSIIKNIKKIL